jgi:hypothetical protein
MRRSNENLHDTQQTFRFTVVKNHRNSVSAIMYNNKNYLFMSFGYFIIIDKKLSQVIMMNSDVDYKVSQMCLLIFL